MSITYHGDIYQNTDEWLALRCGMITASVLNDILTPTLTASKSQETKNRLYQLAAERIRKRGDDSHYISQAMERGHTEEELARQLYGELYSPVKQCGFVVNDSLGFDFGMSPDGLVGDDGIIEIKSRDPKYQLKTFMDHIVASEPKTPIPQSFILQVQAGLLITGRKWCDFISYSNGMDMTVIRIEPIAEYQEAIINAVKDAEATIQNIVEQYNQSIKTPTHRIHPVEWVDHEQGVIAC